MCVRIWRSYNYNCWFCSLSPLQIGASVTPPRVSPFNSGYVLDGLVVCPNQRWKSKVPSHKDRGSGPSGSGLPCFAPKIAGGSLPLCFIAKFHVQRLPPNERMRIFQAEDSACRKKTSKQNNSLEILTSHHRGSLPRIWSAKNMSGTRMLPHWTNVATLQAWNCTWLWDTITIFWPYLHCWIHQMFTKMDELLGRSERHNPIPKHLKYPRSPNGVNRLHPWWVPGSSFPIFAGERGEFSCSIPSAHAAL